MNDTTSGGKAVVIRHGDDFDPDAPETIKEEEAENEEEFSRYLIEASRTEKLVV